MKITSIIKKVSYYKDWRLLLRVFVTSLRISFICLSGKAHLLLSLIPLETHKFTKNQDKEKIARYVYLCLFLRRILGIRDTCFMRSVLLCSILRQAGIEAGINFGSKKEDKEFLGHCWVNQNREDMISGYQLIFRHP
ncbi:MAG: lasso peptide biosynthesis B2 protein [Candidatus Omnitrophica bacterium]|nr:lasso peptide biosynthesis B2 protein [Candidatus Omnitrophota bacterium]MBU1871205.1 lasso peptide biosynthesis B2 protein [Candidatus Omnitrophota bacterium]